MNAPIANKRPMPPRAPGQPGTSERESTSADATPKAASPQVVVRKKPDQGPKLSTALPANHGAFKTQDSRTNAFNAFKEMEAVCKNAIDILDDAKRRALALENIRGLCKTIEEA